MGHWMYQSSESGFLEILYGSFHAFCCYLRLIIAAIWLTIIIPADHALNDPHVVIIDQVSAPIPVMKLINRLVRLFWINEKES